MCKKSKVILELALTTFEGVYYLKKNIDHKYFKNIYLNGILLSFFLNFSIEAFSRHSIIESLRYLTQSPLVFLYNTFLILITLSIALLVKRKIAVATLISTIWLAGGITNGLVLKNRVTPFTANELKLVSSTMDIML